MFISHLESNTLYFKLRNTEIHYNLNRRGGIKTFKVQKHENDIIEVWPFFMISSKSDKGKTKIKCIKC